MAIMDVGRNVMWEKTPPCRLIAGITLVCSTLDLFADIILCMKLGSMVDTFTSKKAINATYFYYFFTVIASVIFVFEVIDIVLTIRNNKENVFLTPFVKSLMIVFEEVPQPILLLIIYLEESRVSIARPALTICCIKLVAMIWGIVKFMQFRFCWFFYCCLHNHGSSETYRRCFDLTKLTRAIMLIVNILHIFSIILLIINIEVERKGLS